MGATRSLLSTAGETAHHIEADTSTRPERLLTAQEVADWLGVSARWVLSHASGVNRPVLPSLKLGKAVRFDRTAVEEFIRHCARMNRYRAV